MGKHGARLLMILGAAAVAVGGYVAVMSAFERSARLNLTVIEPGVLIRSAQPRPGDLDRLLADHGIGAVLCLRGKQRGEVEKWLEEHEVEMVAMDMKADDPPTPDQIALFFGMASGHTVDLGNYRETISESMGVDPNRPARFQLPILMHCEGGADRTGVMAALYRMTFQGWSLDDVKREMRMHWHFPFAHPDQFEFLDQKAAELQDQGGP